MKAGRTGWLEPKIEGSRKNPFRGSVASVFVCSAQPSDTCSQLGYPGGTGGCGESHGRFAILGGDGSVWGWVPVVFRIPQTAGW